MSFYCFDEDCEDENGYNELRSCARVIETTVRIVPRGKLVGTVVKISAMGVSKQSK